MEGQYEKCAVRRCWKAHLRVAWRCPPGVSSPVRPVRLHAGRQGLRPCLLCSRLPVWLFYFLSLLRIATRPINPLPSSQAAAGMGTVEMGRQDQEVPFVMVISAAPTFTPLAHT